MFVKLTAFGEEIVFNMAYVFEFNPDHVEGKLQGSMLHFTNAVWPYGPMEWTHHKKHVDQSTDEILQLLAGGQK